MHDAGHAVVGDGFEQVRHLGDVAADVDGALGGRGGYGVEADDAFAPRRE